MAQQFTALCQDFHLMLHGSDSAQRMKEQIPSFIHSCFLSNEHCMLIAGVMSRCMHYVEKTFTVASWPLSPPLFLVKPFGHPGIHLVSQFVCHLFFQHSDFLCCSEQMLCVRPCLKPLWSVKRSPSGHNSQPILKDGSYCLSLFFVQVIWSVVTKIGEAKRMGWGGLEVTFDL